MYRRYIIFLALAITLLPLTATTGYLAWRSFGEEQLFKAAPLLPSKPSQGKFYKIDGQITGELLNPNQYPEVKNALWYRVVSERRPTTDSPWHRDSTAALASERVANTKINNIPIELGLLAKIALPLVRVEREVSALHRLAIEYRSPLSAESIESQRLSVYGIYQHGTITQGLFERLLITRQDSSDGDASNAQIWQEIARKSRFKGIMLGGISLLFAGLMLASISRSKKWSF